MSFAIAHNTVIDLTDRKIRTVNHQVQSAKVYGFFSSMLVGIFAYLLKRLASKFTDDAIWFRGVSQKFWDENVDVRDLSAEMIPKLEKIKSSVLSLREHVSSDALKTSNPAFRDASSRLIQSAADLFESVEEFKWTLKELEANYSVPNRKFKADTPERVTELLKEI